MGYLFLAIALLCGTVKGYCGKKTSGFIKKASDSVTISLIRMFMCVFIGLAMVFFDSTATFALSPVAIVISLLAGVTSSIFVITWILSIRTGSYMMIDVFLTAGVIIPIFFSSMLFPDAETVTIRQIIGCVLLLVAVIIMCSYNNSIKAKTTLPALLLIILSGVANGCTDLLSKIYVHNEYGSASVFNFYTYVGATVTLALVSLGILIFKPRKDKKALSGDEKPTDDKLKVGKLLPYIAIMALCLFFNSYFKTLSAKTLDAVIIYPISQVGGMMLSSIMAACLFGEKLNAKGIIGMLTALCAMLIINL